MLEQGAICALADDCFTQGFEARPASRAETARTPDLNDRSPLVGEAVIDSERFLEPVFCNHANDKRNGKRRQEVTGLDPCLVADARAPFGTRSKVRLHAHIIDRSLAIGSENAKG